ncbi:hypothetical protein V5799_031072 [Amblyomma americanum]|uniref:Single-pass membrane and coiled-coil domain-containing protein 4 homolog n=1 Tax=Amblyomma americanum TaxID=6943 RepID=A0AAQ4ELA6_AMBAM
MAVTASLLRALLEAPRSRHIRHTLNSRVVCGRSGRARYSQERFQRRLTAISQLRHVASARKGPARWDLQLRALTACHACVVQRTLVTDIACSAPVIFGMGSRNKNKPRLSQRAKQERRKDMSEIQEKMFSVVVPVIVTFAMVVVLIIYVKTRPRTDL